MSFKNKILEFSLLDFYWWKISNDLEYHAHFLKIGTRALLGIQYETACATTVHFLFVRIEIFSGRRIKIS